MVLEKTNLEEEGRKPEAGRALGWSWWGLS